MTTTSPELASQIQTGSKLDGEKLFEAGGEFLASLYLTCELQPFRVI